MSDDPIDLLVVGARTELHDGLNPPPPDFQRLVRSRKRRRISSGVVVVVALAAVAVPVGLNARNGQLTVVTGPTDATPTTAAKPATGRSTAHLPQPGDSRPLATAPLAGRSVPAAVWTGTHMVIWGGSGSQGPFGDGAAYDPRRDAWSVLPEGPLSPRSGPAAVWTGDEVLIWGGSSSEEDFRDGAAYNPVTQQWRPLPDAPIPSAGRPVGLWTGSEMVVLAGYNSPDVAVFDPAANSWRTMVDLPGALQPPSPAATWADGEVIAVVQSGEPGALRAALVAARLDDNTWTTLVDPPGPSVIGWTGEAVLVASKDEAFELDGTVKSPVASAPAGTRVGDAPAVWTGTELVMWEGISASAINPGAATWRLIPSGATDLRTQPALVWADGIILAWGGFPDVAEGVMLRPPS